MITRSTLESRRAALDQNAADAFAAWLLVDAAEHDEGLRFIDTADQRLDAVQHELVAADIGVGAVVRNVRPGVGLGHAHGENDFTGAYARQQAALDAFGGEVVDDLALHAHFAHHGHRGHVAALRDLFENNRRVQHRQAEPAVLLRHGHPQHADLRQRTDVVPREGAVHILRRVRLEQVLAEFAHRAHHAALLFVQFEIHSVLLFVIRIRYFGRPCARAARQRWSDG